VAGPRLVVEPPAFGPRPYGLLSVADVRTNPDNPHWQNGITWVDNCLASGMGNTTWDECIVVTGAGAPPEPPTKTDNVDRLFRGATPFTAYTKFDCAPVGVQDQVALAGEALRQSEDWQVERTFWTGMSNGSKIVFPHLAENTTRTDAQGISIQTAATIVTGTAVDVPTGLGMLEAQLANCYNGVGIIHVPTVALPSFDMWGLVRQRPSRTSGGQFGNQLQTLNGNSVAVGAGYPGTSPAGAAPATGTAWLYATGPVVMYRGSVRIIPMEQSINRTNNTVEMIAERTFVLGFSCCHAAVLVSLGDM
jgi:hypothetical protein